MSWSPSTWLPNSLRAVWQLDTSDHVRWVRLLGLQADQKPGLIGLGYFYRWVLVLFLLPLSFLYMRTKRSRMSRPSANILNPGLLQKHSEFASVVVPKFGFTYPKIRVFFRAHPQVAKLPDQPSPLPLLVFIHGLGGCVAQFYPLLTTLVNNGPCLAVDLPGCGLSELQPRNWDAYRIEVLAALIIEVIKDHLAPGQKVVLIGHSLGCSIATLIASKASPLENNLSSLVSAFVAICPRATPPSPKEIKLAQKLKILPTFVFDLFRRWDRRGGISSPSVLRFTGAAADEQTKIMQLKFNESVHSETWLRMTFGILPTPEAKSGFPGREIWSGLRTPVLAIAGEDDRVTKASEIETITEYLGKSKVSRDENSSAKLSQTNARPSPAVLEHLGPHSRPGSSHGASTHTLSSLNSGIHTLGAQLEAVNDQDVLVNDGFAPAKPTKPRLLKTVTLPAPAGHAMLYMPSSSKILGDVISNFLEDHVSRRLSLAWQLVYLSSEGKWDVKNVEKWKLVLPVSGVIGGVFRAMKTLREVDDSHRPDLFAKTWKHTIKDIVDISHESPVYDPKRLEAAGIRYHKFPTVSKIPPADEDVDVFVQLINSIRETQVKELNTTSEAPNHQTPAEKSVIGVHCHYGYNRTGYFVVCYLVDCCGYKLQDAIDEFEREKPPGIRHPHFINALHVRYCVGLQRRPTIL